MKRFIFKILMLIFSVIALYSLALFSGCMIDSLTPKRKISDAVIKGFDYYIVVKNPDNFAGEIELLNKKRTLPYLVEKKHIEQTVNLLKDTFYASKKQKYVLVGKKNEFYLFIENIDGYVKHRLNLFIKETFSINRNNISISFQREKSYYYKEVSKIKILPRNPVTGLIPPAIVEHVVYIYQNYNGILVTTSKDLLISMIKCLEDSNTRASVKTDINGLFFILKPGQAVNHTGIRR